jgi:uncharacterized repeat protein (TIGR03803 family)
MDKQGNLFGTAAEFGPGNHGLVFKIDLNGTYSILYSFLGTPDGATPYRSRLLLDSKGNLYGLTCSGGAHGFGAVYKLNSQGRESVLYSFTGAKDGTCPLGDLVRDSLGSFYGVTNSGGANGNGVVFKLSKAGRLTVLYTFGAGLDGAPMSGVVLDKNGNIYGTTTFGGIDNRGSVFKLDSTGKRTTLHSFSGGNDGGRPFGELLLDASGVLYGTTTDGGSAQAGVLFEVIP